MEELDNLNDIKIFLNISNKDKTVGFNKFKGSTISDIVERTELSYVKVSQVIKRLIKLGYIEEGLKKVRSKTFYINDIGIKKLAEMKES